MEQNLLTTTLETLTALEDLELALADLYKTCSQLWPDRKEFWMDMEKAEIKHADNVVRMREIISERPENFEFGRPIAISAVKSFISGIKSITQRLKEKEVDEIKALFLLRDNEQSYLETKYAEIIKTEDSEFRRLMREIHADTVFHQEYLDKKINECGKAKTAYQVAKEIPEILTQIPCLCGCEPPGHENLLDCFADRHGEGCVVCQEEALLTKRLYDEKMPIDKIKENIIKKFK